MTVAIFPQSIVSWTDRIDELNTVFADDPNSLAAEIGAIENALGVLPAVEKYPIIASSPVAQPLIGTSGVSSGNTIVYSSVDARLSDMLNGNQLPVCALSSPQQAIPNWQSTGQNYGVWNNYTVDFDPFGMYNGTDITIPADGWWHFSAAQSWEWWSTGYNGMWQWIDNYYYRHHHWFWDYPGNQIVYAQPLGGPATVSSPAVPIANYWYKPGELRPAITSVDWQGVLKAGQRIRVLSENGCPDTPHTTFDMSCQISYVRSVPSNIPSSAVPGNTIPTPPIAQPLGGQ